MEELTFLNFVACTQPLQESLLNSKVQVVEVESTIEAHVEVVEDIANLPENQVNESTTGQGQAPELIELENTENGVQFQGETIDLIEKYGTEHHRLYLYRPQANGVVEAANKVVKKILSKLIVTYKD